jgi:hypothetical protein
MVWIFFTIISIILGIACSVLIVSTIYLWRKAKNLESSLKETMTFDEADEIEANQCLESLRVTDSYQPDGKVMADGIVTSPFNAGDDSFFDNENKIRPLPPPFVETNGLPMVLNNGDSRPFNDATTVKEDNEKMETNIFTDMSSPLEMDEDSTEMVVSMSSPATESAYAYAASNLPVQRHAGPSLQQASGVMN